MGENFTQKVWLSPGLMAPTLGSTRNGGRSGSLSNMIDTLPREEQGRRAVPQRDWQLERVETSGGTEIK